MTEITAGNIVHTELTKNSRGGSELIAERMVEYLSGHMDDFQIIFGRVDKLLDDKVRILYCHDLAQDPASQHLKNGGWKKFHKIVFVSEWQKEKFIDMYGIPHSHTMVIKNAIVPIEKHEKEGKLTLGYWSTPHRGLELLVPVYRELKKEYDIALNVYSSFNIYGWGQRDEMYKDAFDELNSLPDVQNFGSVDNETLREGLKDIHILAYPNIWQETSCMVLMEAMSAGIACVHPNLAALPETAAGWTYQYGFHEDVNTHASIFYKALEAVIVNYDTEMVQWKLGPQKAYADTFYHVGRWQQEWLALLHSDITKQPRELRENNVISFSTG